MYHVNMWTFLYVSCFDLTFILGGGGNGDGLTGNRALKPGTTVVASAF